MTVKMRGLDYLRSYGSVDRWEVERLFTQTASQV